MYDKEWLESVLEKDIGDRFKRALSEGEKAAQKFSILIQVGHEDGSTAWRVQPMIL